MHKSIVHVQVNSLIPIQFRHSGAVGSIATSYVAQGSWIKSWHRVIVCISSSFLPLTKSNASRWIMYADCHLVWINIWMCAWCPATNPRSPITKKFKNLKSSASLKAQLCSMHKTKINKEYHITPHSFV